MDKYEIPEWFSNRFIEKFMKSYEITTEKDKKQIKVSHNTYDDKIKLARTKIAELNSKNNELQKQVTKIKRLLRKEKDNKNKAEKENKELEAQIQKLNNQLDRRFFNKNIRRGL